MGEIETGVLVGVEMGDAVEIVVDTVVVGVVVVVDIGEEVVGEVGWAVADFVAVVAERHFELAIRPLSIAPDGIFGVPKQEIKYDIEFEIA